MRNFTPAPVHFVIQFMLHYGHFEAEPLRSTFVLNLLSWADLDSYAGRAAIEAAFSPAGTLDARCCAAYNLGRAGLLDKADYRYAARRAVQATGGYRHG